MLIILIVSIPLIACCKTTPVETIYVYPELAFPVYPKPNNNVLPLDANGKIVKDNETEVENVIMPLWYYKLIVNYKLENDVAKAKYEAFVSEVKK